MKKAPLETMARYGLAILIGALVAGGGVLQAQLMAGQVVDWTPVLVAILGVLLTGCTTTLLPALNGAGVDPDALTAKQLKQVTDELERRMKQAPAKTGKA
jgi:cation transporter-like permease